MDSAGLVGQLVDGERREKERHRDLDQREPYSLRYLERGGAAQEELQDNNAAEADEEDQGGLDLVTLPTLL